MPATPWMNPSSRRSTGPRMLWRTTSPTTLDISIQGWIIHEYLFNNFDLWHKNGFNINLSHFSRQFIRAQKMLASNSGLCTTFNSDVDQILRLSEDQFSIALDNDLVVNAKKLVIANGAYANFLLEKSPVRNCPWAKGSEALITWGPSFSDIGTRFKSRVGPDPDLPDCGLRRSDQWTGNTVSLGITAQHGDGLPVWPTGRDLHLASHLLSRYSDRLSIG